MRQEFHFTTVELGEHLFLGVQHRLGVREGTRMHFKTRFTIVDGEMSRVSLIVSEDPSELEESPK